MRNQDGLTHKEWLFCEEYLRDGNMERAYRVAYPNDKGRNGWRTMKRKEVVAYLNKRLQEKQQTLDRLVDKSYTRLARILENGDDKEANKASEIILNIKSRLKELETKATTEVTGNLQITFKEVKKNDN